MTSTTRRPVQPLPHKERLLRSGMKLFYEQGFHGTTVDAVLAAAEVPKGSFYHHFGSKDAFAQAVLDRYLWFQLEVLQKWVDKKDVSTADKIAGHFNDMVRMFVKSGCQRGCLTGKLSTEVAGTSELFRNKLSEQISRWRDALVDILRHGQDRGDVRLTEQPEDIAAAVFAIMQGAFVVALSTRDEHALAKLADTIKFVIQP